MNTDRVFTAEGAPNIALIKYWGKRDEKLILPQNSSISLTLSRDTLHTTTSVLVSSKLDEDRFYLDGEMQDLKDKDVAERFGIVEIMRKMAGIRENILIVSRNDFPTASGMASSASGIATLVYVLDKAFGLGLSPKKLSIVARQGSGSACRSLFGGLVEWKRGVKPDGSDSYAQQVFDEKHWPELMDNIAIVSQEKKKVPSRAGMRQTVRSNPLYASRPAAAEKRISELVAVYGKKNFDSLAELIMADSNEMHALMLSTMPSIRYLNRSSYKVMDLIEDLNISEGKNIAAYTFDAGPNAHVITLSKHNAKVMKALEQLKASGDVFDVRQSKIGHGPSMLGKDFSLIDEAALGQKAEN